MDLVLTVVFFICAILAVAGALGAALAPTASWRLLGLLGLAVGTAGVLASFSTGFAALIAVVCLAASAVLVGGGAEPVRQGPVSGLDLPAQVGAVAAAALLAVLLVVAVAGSFAAGVHGGAAFDVATLGRLFFGRDAIALEAVAASLMVALAFGALARSRRP